MAGWHVDFKIYNGMTDDVGSLMSRMQVTLDQGGGSEGHATTDLLVIGTYTVCEVEIAYRGNAANELVADPMPTGTNQRLFNDECITVNLTPGIAQLTFRDVLFSAAVTPAPTPTLGPPISAPPSPTPTPMLTPPPTMSLHLAPYPAPPAAHPTLPPTDFYVDHDRASGSPALLLALLVAISAASAAIAARASRRRYRAI
jgi:hypothetical protein